MGFTRIALSPAPHLVLTPQGAAALPCPPSTSRNLLDQIPRLPGTRQPSTSCCAGPRGRHPHRGEATHLPVTYSWAHSTVGLPPLPEPGALVSPGHGKAWALGSSKEASLDSSLRHCPQGQTISSLSLALQRSGLAEDWVGQSWAEGQGLQALCAAGSCQGPGFEWLHPPTNAIFGKLRLGMG